ncbi:MAG: SurA N-terminal domain-containing protein, partial [Pirellulales bacterium]
MASPFKIFRKHQKFMIATLAILAMGAFVFLDPLMGILGGGGGGGPAVDAVLVRWDHGKLRKSDLDRMVLTRRILNRFVQIAAQMGAEASGTTPQPHPGLGPETERDVVRTMLFTQAAEDAGFVISDGAVNRYIKQLTRNSVSSARLRQIILGTYINGQPVTMDVIFAALRTELLAQQFLGSYLIAADSVTPLERWITWLRINKRVSAELVPVSVQQFMNDVPAPADEELKAFYDQYKDVIKRPVIVDGTMMDSPDPGFKEPRRVTFEFVRADYDAVVDGIKPTITDAEIETYYNENKRNFVQPGLLEDEPAAEQRGPADREDPGTSPGDRKLDEPATGDVDSPAKADKTQEKEEPAKEEPAKEEPAKEEPAKEEPA